MLPDKGVFLDLGSWAAQVVCANNVTDGGHLMCSPEAPGHAVYV